MGCTFKGQATMLPVSEQTGRRALCWPLLRAVWSERWALSPRASLCWGQRRRFTAGNGSEGGGVLWPFWGCPSVSHQPGWGAGGCRATEGGLWPSKGPFGGQTAGEAWLGDES